MNSELSEHKCETNLSFLKLKSSDKSLKYQCNICKALFRQVVNQFNYVNTEYIPYKCAGYMIKNSQKCKCDAPTTKFYRNYAYCEAHTPRRLVIGNKTEQKTLDMVANFDYTQRTTRETCTLYNGNYDECKDNLTGYLEL